MKTRAFVSAATFFICTAMFAPLANAGLITVNGHLFDDLGTSTVDKASGLEWLDVTATYKRSYNNVFNDITTAGGTFEITDGWRFATVDDFTVLMSHWFGQPYRTFTPFDKLATATFIKTFGDVMDVFYDDPASSQHSVDVSNAPDSAGATGGFLAPPVGYGRDYTARASVSDMDLTWRGESALINDGSDQVYTGRAERSDRDIISGSFLVRIAPVNLPVAKVSEPGALMLLLISIAGLGLVRRMQFHR